MDLHLVELAGLGGQHRPLLVIAVGATASMAALPPFFGFVAKEADLETVLHSPTLAAAAHAPIPDPSYGIFRM